MKFYTIHQNMKDLQDKIKLGNFAIDFNIEDKDVFHVVGYVLCCPFHFSPGDSLKYRNDEDENLIQCERTDPGRQFIVDPFLLEDIPKYTRFWALPVLSSVVKLTHTFQILGRDRVVVELPRGTDEDSISCALQGC